MPYANNKGADQPAHPRSLISAFVVRCLGSIIPLVSIHEISSFYMASVAEQAGLCQPWSQTPKTGFLVSWLKLRWRTEDQGDSGGTVLADWSKRPVALMNVATSCLIISRQFGISSFWSSLRRYRSGPWIPSWFDRFNHSVSVWTNKQPLFHAFMP